HRPPRTGEPVPARPVRPTATKGARMSTLSVRLFGRLCAVRDERVLDGLEGGKAQELLCYLLLNRDRPHARQTLAGLLWGDCLAAQSQKYLRQALWQLQSALDPPGASGGGRVFLVESDWIQVHAAADLWLDVAEFEQAFGLVQGVAGRELDVAQ